MSFTPAIPLGGYAGWGFLKRTMATQKTAFEATGQIQRDAAYFREKIADVKTAEALVADRRLLGVALGAFGLEADIGNTYFIRKVLEDGTFDTGALANKLADKQYQKLSVAFGFGDFAIPRTQLSDFADKILTSYKERSFEAAVGTQNSDMRLALNAERELASLAKAGSSEDTKWYTIMGSAPLRKVFETAFGLPASFGALDLDQQLVALRAKADQAFGADTVSQFSDSEQLDGLLRRFLLRSELAGVNQAARGQSAALQILQSGSSASGLLSLL